MVCERLVSVGRVEIEAIEEIVCVDGAPTAVVVDPGLELFGAIESTNKILREDMTTTRTTIITIKTVTMPARDDRLMP